MKTNAIIRIILFSVAIFLLLGILGLGLGITTFMGRFSSEHTSDEVIHIPQSVASNSYTADPAQIREIEIEWAAGSITIQPAADLTEIRVTETEPSDDKYKMVCRQSGDTLSIQFCKDSIQFPSFGVNGSSSKDLLIQVPADWACNSLEIDAASADVKLQNLTIPELDFDGASGSCDLISCDVGSMNLDAASGNVSFSGSLNSLDFDGASADCDLVLSNCPSRIDLDGMSGRLDITLPSDCGFSVDTQGISCDFTTDFETTTRDGIHYHGNGQCRINIDAISGNVCIRKGSYTGHSSEADCPGSCNVHPAHDSGHH